MTVSVWPPAVCVSVVNARAEIRFGDQDWLENCRNDDYSKESRERVCEVRHLGFRAAEGPDPRIGPFTTAHTDLKRIAP